MALSVFLWKNKGEPEPTPLNRQNLNAAEEALAAQVSSGAIAPPASVASGSSVGAGYNGLVWNSTSKTWEQANVPLRRGMATEPTSALKTYTMYPKEYGANEAETEATTNAFVTLFEHVKELVEATEHPLFTFNVECEQYAYYVTGALKTNQGGNAQIPLPDVLSNTSGAPLINIRIMGNGGGTHFVSRLEGATYSAEKGKPSMLGGPTPEQVGINATFANIFFEMYNASLNLTGNPSLCGADLSRVLEAKIDRVFAQSSLGESEEPTHPCGVGIHMPESDNGGIVEVGVYKAKRLYAGMVANCAHLRASSIFNRNCVLALGMTGNEQYGGNDGHAAWIDYLQTVESIHHLAGWNPTEGAVSVPEGHRVKLTGGQWDIEEENESLHPNWFDTKDHLLDANNQFFGGFNWINRVRQNVGGEPVGPESPTPLKKVGGRYFSPGNDLSAENNTAPQTFGSVSFASGAITLSSVAGEPVTGKEPAALVASPEESGEIKHVYVVNFGGNTISRYSRNGTSGALTLLGTTATGSKPRGIAITSNGKYVYVSYYGEAKIGCFERNLTTGELTLISGHETIATGTSPYQVIVDPAGETVYVVAEKEEGAKYYVWQYKIESGGVLVGLGTPKVETGANPTHLAITASGKYVYIVAQGAESSKFYIWQYEREAGGALKSLGTKKVEVAGKCTGITCGASAHVYATGFTAERLYQWKIGAGGALEALAPEYVATGKEPFAVACTPDGKNVYTTNAAANTLGIYERNTSTGLLTAASPASVATGKEPQGVIAAGNSTVYTTNYATSSMTVGQYLRHLAVEVSDPGTTAASQIFFSQNQLVVGPLRYELKPGEGFKVITASTGDSGKAGWFRIG